MMRQGVVRDTCLRQRSNEGWGTNIEGMLRRKTSMQLLFLRSFRDKALMLDVLMKDRACFERCVAQKT